MKRTALLFILFLALLLRIYRIGHVPPALSLDEVSIGYNAYSILKTGADEYGTKFPILLRAYDDWRPALYVYLVIPSIKLLGLTPLAVRLPSVILGTFTVLLTYFLVQELFTKSRFSTLYSLLSALLLAISPWHIYISRLSHEVNLGLTLTVLGIYGFFRAIAAKKNAWWLTVSAVVFASSLNSYQSQKIVAPVLVIALGILFWKQLILIKKQLLISLITGFIVAFPIVFANLQPEALIRLRATSAFSANQRKIEAAKTFFSNYISHFSPSWLFTGGDRESHKVPGMGLLYIWEAPLIVMGMVWLLRSGLEKRVKVFFLLWLLSAPLPAAITTQAPHAMRSFTFLPVWQVLGALGLMILWGKPTKLAWLTFGLVILGSLGYFAKQYYVVFPKTQSDSFQYALTRAIPLALQEAAPYDRVVFSNTGQLYQSYMFFLFYSRYDPEQYQKNGGTWSGGFAETHEIGKFEFRPIVWKKEKLDDKTLFIGNPSEVPDNAHILHIVSNLDGAPAIVIAGTKI